MRKVIASITDRFWLLTLAMASLIVIGAISGLAIWKGLPDKTDVLLGSVVTGLMIFMREIVATVRAWWTDEKTQRLTDQLSGTATGPIEAKITNAPDEPVPVEPKP